MMATSQRTQCNIDWMATRAHVKSSPPSTRQTLKTIQENEVCSTPPTARPIPHAQMSTIRARINTRQLASQNQTDVPSQRSHRPNLTTHRMQRCNAAWPPPSTTTAVSSSNLLSELRKQQLQRKSHTRPSNRIRTELSQAAQSSHRSHEQLSSRSNQTTRSTSAPRPSHMFVDANSTVVELPLDDVLEAMHEIAQADATNNTTVESSSQPKAAATTDTDSTGSSQSSAFSSSHSQHPTMPTNSTPLDGEESDYVEIRNSRHTGILVKPDEDRHSLRQSRVSGIQFADRLNQTLHPTYTTPCAPNDQLTGSEAIGFQEKVEDENTFPRKTGQGSIHSFTPLELQELDRDSPRPSEDEFELPDREELTDQLEWDVGVAQTLFHFKRLQIEEQINIDMRSRKSKTTKPKRLKTISSLMRKSAQVAQVKERRKSCMDHMRASQACGFATCPALPDFNARPQSRISQNSLAGRRSRDSRGSRGSRQHSITKPKFLSAEYRLADEMRSKSQRALFEGLAHTAEMSRDRWYIFRPTGSTRHLWSNLVAIATTVTAILSPLLACQVLDSGSTSTDVTEVMVDLVFLSDIAINFLTAYQDEVRDIVVTSPSHIRMRYLTSWFWFDIVSALPIDWFLRIAYGNSTNLSAWRLLKITRAYHMFSAEDVHLNLGDTAINPSLIALFKLTLALGLFWHITACLYSLMSVATIQSIKLDTNTSDNIISMFDASVIQSVTNLRHEPVVNRSSFHLGLIIDNDTPLWHMPPMVWDYGPLARYLYSVSWAIAVTCQTHRPTPDTFVQLLMSDIVSVSGLFLMTGIIGAATAAISEMQAQRSENTRLLQRIAHYMRNKRLPRDLRRRVLSFYRFHQSSMNILENEEVLVGLPRAMRMQINLLMHKSVFVKLPLFWLCTEEEMLLIVQRLRPCLIMPGEMMLKEGTIGAGLFLLMKGAVETIAEGELLVVLLAVAAFGEAALQSEEASKVTIRALRFCETSLLMRADWVVIEKLNPRIRTWLDIYINERDRKIRDPTVKSQSQQTKKATIRCGAAGYRDWNEMRNSTGSKSNKYTTAHAITKFSTLFHNVRKESLNISRKSTEATSNFRRRVSSIIKAANAFSIEHEQRPKQALQVSKDSKDSNALYASSKKLPVCDGHATNRDDVRNSGYFPGLDKASTDSKSFDA